MPMGNFILLRCGSLYADVKLLASVGILELKAAGKRDAVKPVALYSGFELDLAA